MFYIYITISAIEQNEFFGQLVKYKRTKSLGFPEVIETMIKQDC